MAQQKKSTSLISLSGIPRVNLLPPEVVERRVQQGRVRGFVLLVVLVVVLVAGAYAASLVWSISTQTTLAGSQAQSQSLLEQQGAFAEAKATNDSINQITEALKVTTSSEVSWADLYAVVERNLPAGARISAADFTGRAPFEGALVPPSPISLPKVAIMKLGVTMNSPEDATTFIDSVSKEDKVAGATLVDLTGAPGEYLATIRVDFNTKALAQRFGDEASK